MQSSFLSSHNFFRSFLARKTHEIRITYAGLRIAYEAKQLSFVQISRFGDRQFRPNFAGSIERSKLAGTLSSDRGEGHAGSQEGLIQRRLVGLLCRNAGYAMRTETLRWPV